MQRPSFLPQTLVALCLLNGLAAAASGSAPTADPRQSAAEAAGWTLFFQDDFEREAVGEAWETLEGDWEIVDGALRGSGTLISARGIPGEDPPGFLRLEFEAVSDVKPIIFFPDRPKPKVALGDMSVFLHAQPPEGGLSPLKSGYFFQFGGILNTINRLTRAGVEVAVDRDTKQSIVQDAVHHVVVENDQGTLRMTVDGVNLFDVAEKQSILGTGYDRVGFYFYTAAKVHWVKVYAKRLPDGLDLD